MAICASVDSATRVIMATGTPVGECVSLVLLEPHEWVTYSVWSIPPTSELFSYWWGGFSYPLICFLIAWGVGRLVHFPRV